MVKGHGNLYPLTFYQPRTAPGLVIGHPIVAGMGPDFSRETEGPILSNNDRSVISYRRLVDLHTVGINAPGSPYLERVDPDVMRRGSSQDIRQFPVAPPGIVKAAVAVENPGIRGIEGSGNSVQLLPQFRLQGAPVPDSFPVPRPSLQCSPRSPVGIRVDSDCGHMNRDPASPHDTPDMLVRPAPMPQFGGGSVARIDIDKRGGPPSRNGELQGEISGDIPGRSTINPLR